jgi:hypothetical protein
MSGHVLENRNGSAMDNVARGCGSIPSRCDVQARRQRDCRQRDRADKVVWLLYHGHGRQVPHPPVVYQLPVTAIGRASGRAAVATAATEPGMTTENHSTSDATDNRPRPPQATFSSCQFARLTQRRGPKASTSAFAPERPSSVRAQRASRLHQIQAVTTAIDSPQASKQGTQPRGLS